MEEAKEGEMGQDEMEEEGEVEKEVLVEEGEYRHPVRFYEPPKEQWPEVDYLVLPPSGEPGEATLAWRAAFARAMSIPDFNL